ncbi:MAG TPA: hypothetical protein VK699_02960 [Terriglobales bacterium]|jgi:hypothetical protein|nr:hypothetical protein [Terriglobales bacterium]
MEKFVMQFKAACLLASVLLILPALSFAGGSSCSAATAVIPDGRSLELDYAQPSSTAWYQFNATANRSYSVEVRDDLDPDNGDFTVSFYPAPVNCSSPASNTNYTDTHLIEPAAGAHATRFSFVPTTTGAYYVSVLNGSTSIGHYVTVTVTETTLYITNWSTYSSLTTFFGFQNTTSQCISYTLTLVPVVGSTQNATASGTVGTTCATSPTPLATANTGPSGLNLTNQAGIAYFTHNGPPGAIQGYAISANFGTTPFTILNLPVGPMRGK